MIAELCSLSGKVSAIISYRLKDRLCASYIIFILTALQQDNGDRINASSGQLLISLAY